MALPLIDVAQRRARLAVRHRLLPAERTDDIAAIAEDLVAVHSSDPVSVYLSAMVRMRSPSIAAVDAALYEQRSVVRHHAMRRTLWVATPPTARRMHGAATRKIAAVEQRRTVKMLQDNGIDDGFSWLEAAKRDVLAVLRAQGPMTARQLGKLVPALTHPLNFARETNYAGTQYAHTRVLAGLGFDGLLVRTRPTGSWINGQYTWAAMDSWLADGVDGVDEQEAARDLADHWLRRFGPATTTDLQWWMGWTLGLTRQALTDCAAVPAQLDDGPAWVAQNDIAEIAPAPPWVAVLPGLDPTTMGWKQRDWYLPAAAELAFDRNGNAGPTIWVDGTVVGAWVQAASGEIRTHYFLPVPASRRKQVQERVDELREWIGDTRFSVRFPGRIQLDLLDPARLSEGVVPGP